MLGKNIAHSGDVSAAIECLPDFVNDVLPHLDAAYNLARWLTRHDEDAQDVVQEAYMRAFRFMGGFRGGSVRAWVLKIARNTCYTWMHRNRPQHPTLEFDEELFGPDPLAPTAEEAISRNDDCTLVRRALQGLSQRHREVLILRELEGLSYKEISEIMDMPAGTVMSRLSGARDELRGQPYLEVAAKTRAGPGAPSAFSNRAWGWLQILTVA